MSDATSDCRWHQRGKSSYYFPLNVVGKIPKEWKFSTMAPAHVILFDPAIVSDNDADRIASAFARREVLSTIANCRLVHIPSRDLLGPVARQNIAEAEFTFLTGPVLNSRIDRVKTWGVAAEDLLKYRNIILFGAGWQIREDIPNDFTAMFLQETLHQGAIHAVADRYTQQQLAAIGIRNTIVTGAPGCWRVASEGHHLQAVGHPGIVIVHLSRSAADRDTDIALLTAINKEYREVFLWGSTPRDFEYAEVFNGDYGELLTPQLEAVTAVFGRGADYIGNDFDIGMHALDLGCRAFFLWENLAVGDIQENLNLPVSARSSPTEVIALTDKPYPQIDTARADAIDQWRAQFRALEPA
jgi:hypothetical protein